MVCLRGVGKLLYQEQARRLLVAAGCELVRGQRGLQKDVGTVGTVEIVGTGVVVRQRLQG